MDVNEKIREGLKALTPIQLGRVPFRSPLLLAPLSGITDSAVRPLMEELGAGGTVSELISCHAINYDNKRTHDMLALSPREIHAGLQLFGSDPVALAKAAVTAQSIRPQFIDINMGCPVPKVVNSGAGSALMKDLGRIEAILSAVREAIHLPLSIKIRLGWDVTTKNAEHVIEIAANHGVEWVTIHGRTRSQFYTGEADWEAIESLAKHAPLPIVGNGDLVTPDQIQERLKITHCKALMVGRGALKNPFLFLETFSPHRFSMMDMWFAVDRLNTLYTEVHAPERVRLIQMRKHLASFTSGMPRSSSFRQTLFETDTVAQVLEIGQKYLLSS